MHSHGDASSAPPSVGGGVLEGVIKGAILLLVVTIGFFLALLLLFQSVVMEALRSTVLFQSAFFCFRGDHFTCQSKKCSEIMNLD